MALHSSCCIPSSCLFNPCLPIADIYVSSLDISYETETLGPICPLSTSNYVSMYVRVAMTKMTILTFSFSPLPSSIFSGSFVLFYPYVQLVTKVNNFILIFPLYISHLRMIFINPKPVTPYLCLHL